MQLAWANAAINKRARLPGARTPRSVDAARKRAWSRESAEVKRPTGIWPSTQYPRVLIYDTFPRRG